MIIKNFADGFGKAIFDLPTQTIIPFPETTDAEVDWLTDSRVLVGKDQSLITYRINFDEGTMQQDETFMLDVTADLEIATVQQLADGRFVYALVSQDLNPAASGLFSLTSFSQQPVRDNGIPNLPGVPGFVWSPDGTEAVQDFGRQKFLATADGNLFVFQEHVWGFKWMAR